MVNRVEEFEATTPSELEIEINSYCRRYNCIPISISVSEAYGQFYAFVVVKEGADNG